MATITKGYTFTDSIPNAASLNNLVANASVASIVTADMDDGIVLPQHVSVGNGKLRYIRYGRGFSTFGPFGNPLETNKIDTLTYGAWTDLTLPTSFVDSGGNTVNDQPSETLISFAIYSLQVSNVTHSLSLRNYGASDSVEVRKFLTYHYGSTPGPPTINLTIKEFLLSVPASMKIQYYAWTDSFYFDVYFTELARYYAF